MFLLFFKDKTQKKAHEKSREIALFNLTENQFKLNQRRQFCYIEDTINET